ncbi:UDP-glycosyltransferase 87A1-like [Syzygium oleosum]|uniref:UDP-glycosyltransferase 87A1-like n=1 Tax=Syzygium oleosum TaxID=219896 RepID=UPI0024BAA681|nr:UDP-glycosyltransferase 87A1-like [Syzygium oleosum]
MEAPGSSTSAMAAASSLHMVAMPYLGRGHINPMMNFCRSLSSRVPDIAITFVVTEEWLGFIGSEPKPANISLAAIPNVLPSELVRAQHYSEFSDAVFTKMGDPFEELLDWLRPVPTIILADTSLKWAVRTGNWRNIPVASFWPMSAWVFSFFHHFHLLERYGHFPVDLSERGDEQVDYIPGLPPTRLADLIRSGRNDPILQDFLDALKIARESKYLLLAAVYEVDCPAVDAVKASLSFPVYTIGLAIPLSRLADDSCLNEADYLKWLDREPSDSVLYISLGSFLSVSSSKRDEIAGCLRDSGIRFVWTGHKEASRLKELCSNRGIVVPWCDQLRVLSRSSVGGFWTHCGWNSILEAVFMGFPMLVYPIAMDQHRNASLVVEDWKIGWRVGTDITGLMRKLMDLEDNESREIRRQAKHLQEVCWQAIGKDGSTETNINAFFRDISYCNDSSERFNV